MLNSIVKLYLIEREPITLGDLELQPTGLSVKWKGTDVKTTPMQFALIYEMASQPNRIMTREYVIDNLVENDEANWRLVDSLIKLIRKSFAEVDSEFYFIATVWGVGWVWTPRYRTKKNPKPQSYV